MLVIADIEWISENAQEYYPTQLAAARVDESWKSLREFHSFIHPENDKLKSVHHIAYKGGRVEEFLSAPELTDVLYDFLSWIKEDDIIIWWHSESEILFRNLVGRLAGNFKLPKMLSINRYVYAFLTKEKKPCGGIYDIAENEGVNISSSLKHYSKNDVRVFREFMAAIKFPQSEIESISECPDKAFMYNPTYLYRYDPKTNKIHSADCPLVDGVETSCCSNIKIALRKEYEVCQCCKKEYMSMLRQRNIRLIKHNGFRFIYSPGSSVFHKNTCNLVLSAKQINGSPYYDRVAKTGRTPCKICKPQNEVRKPSVRTKINIGSLKKEYTKAIIRQKHAVKERQERLSKGNLTETQRADVMTLTQPGYAFWAIRGYANFHLRSCHKLNNANNLVGFSTFNEAVSAGYTPCRKCKPTKKHDAVYSIPITSNTRENEKVEDLISLCKSYGYKHITDTACFCIETPVGKWKFNTDLIPYKLEHINLVVNPWATDYHDQARLFLSLTDVLEYIKKHDDSLEEKRLKGKIFVKRYANDTYKW